MKASTQSIKRVAFIVPKLGRGGAERVVMQLIQSFNVHGISTMCICLEEKGLLGEDLTRLGFRVECFHSHRGYDLKAVIKLFRVLRSFRPSIVNVHGYGALPYASLVYLLGARFPIVLTGHGLLFSNLNKRRLLYKNAARCLAGLTAVTAEVANRHGDYLNWNREIDIIHNGIEPISLDVEGGLLLKEKFGIEHDIFVFLIVGNIRPEKGCEDLIEAINLLARLSDAEIRFCVVVAGAKQNDTYYEYILEKAKDLSVDNLLKFIGHRTDMSSVYALADALVLPSRSEGLPMVILEAMSSKLPIIATDVGGVTAVLSGGGGIIVPHKNPHRLARAMASILSNPEKGKIMGKVGHQRVLASYSLMQMTEGYLNAFKNVLEKRF